MRQENRVHAHGLGVRADLAFYYLAAGLDLRAAEEAKRVIEVAPEFTPAHVFAVLANERLARWDEAAQSARVLLDIGRASARDLERIDGAEPKDVVVLAPLGSGTCPSAGRARRCRRTRTGAGAALCRGRR